MGQRIEIMNGTQTYALQWQHIVWGVSAIEVRKMVTVFSILAVLLVGVLHGILFHQNLVFLRRLLQYHFQWLRTGSADPGWTTDLKS